MVVFFIKVPQIVGTPAAQQKKKQNNGGQLQLTSCLPSSRGKYDARTSLRAHFSVLIASVVLQICFFVGGDADAKTQMRSR